MKHDTGLLTKSAHLAEQAYKDEIPGAKKFENKRTDTTCFVLKTADVDYVVWRGTESRRDWLYNLLFIPRPIRGAWIHMGFYRHQQGVWKDVRKELNPAKKTVQIGHSLGGACAEIACHLSREFNNLHLVSWGKPNTFSKFKACRMDHLKSQYSIVNGSDIVARIPRVGYRPSTGNHLRQIWFANDGTDFVNPDTETKKADWKASDSVSDHMMDKYVSRMAVFCKNNTVADPIKLKRPVMPKKKKRG